MGAADHATAPRRVSTGVLPQPDRMRALLEEAHARFGPADPNAFDLCIVSVDGSVTAVGEAETRSP